MYKLTKIEIEGTMPYGMEVYRLTEETSEWSKELHRTVTIKTKSTKSEIYGGLFRRSSEVTVPDGQIEIYLYPPACVPDSIYPLMIIPTSLTVIIFQTRTT